MKRFIYTMAVVAMFMFSADVQSADVTQHQWVRLNSSGGVTGRVVIPRQSGISALRDADVKLVSLDGRSVSDVVMSDKTGRFNIKSVTPGVYALMIQGDGSFVCCAMHVVNEDVKIDSTFEVAVGTVDSSAVKNLMLRYAPVGQPTDVEFDPTTNPWETDRAMSGEQLRIAQDNGGVRGRLTRAGFGDEMDAPNTNVIIFRDGVEVARTTTDS